MGSSFDWPSGANSDDDQISPTEPEIIRTMAVGSFVVRAERGAVYIEAHERLPGEVRVVCRVSMTTETARTLVGLIECVLPKRRH